MPRRVDKLPEKLSIFRTMNASGDVPRILTPCLASGRARFRGDLTPQLNDHPSPAFQSSTRYFKRLQVLEAQNKAGRKYHNPWIRSRDWSLPLPFVARLPYKAMEACTRRSIIKLDALPDPVGTSSDNHHLWLSPFRLSSSSS
jgi:hypothetical protein